MDNYAIPWKKRNLGKVLLNENGYIHCVHLKKAELCFPQNGF